MEGILYKQGDDLLKRWKKRLFQVLGNELIYYESESKDALKIGEVFSSREREREREKEREMGLTKQLRATSHLQ